MTPWDDYNGIQAKISCSKRRKSLSPGYESDEDALNPGDFLWEPVQSHPFCQNLTEIFNTVMKSGCKLSGPESSDDFSFWLETIRLMKWNMTLGGGLVGKRNVHCLREVLAYATEVFSGNEQSHIVERWYFSNDFLGERI